MKETVWVVHVWDYYENTNSFSLIDTLAFSTKENAEKYVSDMLQLFSVVIPDKEKIARTVSANVRLELKPARKESNWWGGYVLVEPARELTVKEVMVK